MQQGLPPSGAPPQGMEGQMPGQQFMQPGTLQPMTSPPPPPPGTEPGIFAPPPGDVTSPPPDAGGSTPPPPSSSINPNYNAAFILKAFEPLLKVF